MKTLAPQSNLPPTPYLAAWLLLGAVTALPLACGTSSDDSSGVTSGDGDSGDGDSGDGDSGDGDGSRPPLDPADCPECPATCENGVQDADEEGLDCGGPCISCDGLSLPSTHSPIKEYYAEFVMPVERNECSTLHRPHSQPMWSIFPAGRCAGCWIPSRMNSAAFDDTLIVSWVGSAQYADEEDPSSKRYGHISTFKFSADGGFEEVSDFYFEGCTYDMGSISVSPDGQVIGALCLAHDDSLMGDYLDSAPEPANPGEEQREMYLLEWTGGEITQTPDTVVRLSRVSGGWHYGHWDLSLSNDLSHYFVEEKATGGGHETELYYTLDRTNYDLADRDANCGGGHTLSNRITKNTHDDSWSTFCSIDTDGLIRWRPFPKQDYVSTVDSSSLEVAEGDKVWTATLGKFENRGPIELAAGGVANMISLGSRGWLATALGPFDIFEGAEAKEDMAARLPYQQIGFRRLPLTMKEFVESESDYAWNWVDLDDVCEPTKGGNQRVGMVQLHNWGPGGENSGRILLGYSPAMEHPGRTNEYHVVEVDEDGTFLHDPVLLEHGGWGVDSLGTYMPGSGCVVFPHTWLSDESTTGSSEDYPKHSLPVTDRSRFLKFTALCPTEISPLKTEGRCVTRRALVGESPAHETPEYQEECPTAHSP